MQDACDRGLDPDEFVEDMKKRGIRVAGIGHRIKSKVCHRLFMTFQSPSWHLDPLSDQQGNVDCERIVASI